MAVAAVQQTSKGQLIKRRLAETAQADGADCPPLMAGDRLTRAEFERRYEATPAHIKAELIGGVVYMPSPLGWPHGYATRLISNWLGAYQFVTPNVDGGDNATTRMGVDDEPQPDASLRLIEGGTSWLSAPVQTPRGKTVYLEGAPELVVEVAFSTASYDLHDKQETYRRNGVKEYLVWLLSEEQFIWFRLQEGVYVRIKPDRRGVIESAVFPGLRLKVKALLAGRMKEVLAELQQGLAAPAYAEFVKQQARTMKTAARRKRR
ncbi:MAG: Uma2 family endonuclease [Acidobacteria bacterium]|nr:Uma2 family endonuclease [Acidobacteriota bacterium]MBI3428375.1 Uma2 family endonuclease [Acidobacteriota bacterium]